MNTAATPETVLGPRALNRATLARQHLLGRSRMPALDMVEHLVGMQAQEPENPYVALWSRIEGSQPAELSGLIEAHRASRGGLMRGTLHLVSERDMLAFQPLMRPVLARVLHTQSPFGRRLAGLDVDELMTVGRVWLEDLPRTRAELVPLLAERWPEHDASSLAYALTYLLPLVQVTPRGLWHRSGRAAFTTVEAWHGRAPDAEPDVDTFVFRYLAAFGPASASDIRIWSGLTGVGAVVDRLRHRLVTVRDETGRELFDLTDAPRPDPDTRAPVRFLPEYDNVLLGFADRSRFGTDPRVAPLFAEQRIGLGAILVDGTVRGTWRVRRDRSTARMTIRMLDPLAPSDATAVDEEGAALLDVLADDLPGRELSRTTFDG
jgi:hypothetical protein